MSPERIKRQAGIEQKIEENIIHCLLSIVSAKKIR